MAKQQVFKHENVRETVQILGGEEKIETAFFIASLLQDDRRRMYQLNNSVAFNGKPIGSEKFLNRMCCHYFN